MKTKIIFSLLFLATLIGCKYEDGPLISFRTAYKRVIGSYQAEAFQIDGQDAMQIWKDSVCDIGVIFYTQEEPLKSIINVGSSFGGLGGQFKLTNNNRKISFYRIDGDSLYPGCGPFDRGKESTWNILKLSNQRMWIETDFEGHDYLLKLKKTNDSSK
ncbi:MAG: hypothetical protein WCM76_14130 [Bacteroidota bacterium]